MRNFAAIPVRALSDRRLGERALRVLGAICSRAQRRKPLTSLSDLADDTAIDRRGIPVEIRKLVSAGYILREPGTHSSDGSKYTVLYEEPEAPAETAEVTRQDVSPDTPTHDRVSRQEAQSVTPGRDPYIDGDKGEEFASRTTRARENAAIDAEFESWFAEYPHRVNRPAALIAYRQARKIASAGELLLGVRRYVESKPPDQKPLNPDNWLKQQRWLDQPAPHTVNGNNGAQHDQRRRSAEEKTVNGFARSAGFDPRTGARASDALLHAGPTGRNQRGAG